MSTIDPVTLPLVAQSCTLEPSQLHDQLERYRKLSRHIIRLQREPGQLVAQFSPDLPAGLVEQTVEIERGCCAFLSIAYDALNHQLTVTSDAADQDTTLAALLSVLNEPSCEPSAKDGLLRNRRERASVAVQLQRVSSPLLRSPA